MAGFFARLFPFRKVRIPDRYHLRIVTSPEEMTCVEMLPLEIRFVLTKVPERIMVFRDLLERGFGIGVRTVDHTPDALLKAIDHISQLTQENTIIPWLPRLLREGEIPVFSEFELRLAEQKKINLYEEARLILARRFEFKKIVLVDLENKGLSESERDLMDSVNRDLYPFAIDYIVNRVLFDNAHTRTEVAQSIIKALLIVGPIAHVLEHWVHGIGKIFAASADDLLAETAELFALRGSGFTWRQLMKRSRILVPVFALATYGAFSVEGLIMQGRLGLAGVVFGASAVALSLTTAIQSIGMYRQAYVRLVQAKKLATQDSRALWRLALRQDFTNPARLGLFIGACTAPLMAAVVFSLFPALVYNGWILALLGSTESLVAGVTVFSAARINRYVFRRRVLVAMRTALDKPVELP
ncbi:MAG: hypothetical protein WCV84_01990 [Patescibacteria group bacterium]